MRYRVQGEFVVTVNGDGSRSVSETYDLSVSKDWNFDIDKKLIVKHDLMPFALMQGIGAGREYHMYGHASGFSNYTVV